MSPFAGAFLLPRDSPNRVHDVFRWPNRSHKAPRLMPARFDGSIWRRASPIKDTTGRFPLGCPAFLASADGDGDWAVAACSGARVESLHAMPRDNTTGPASREVTDETGRTVGIPQSARRIVSLAPNLTETLFALGLGDRVVGDTDFCDYPPEARSKPHGRAGESQSGGDCGAASRLGAGHARDQPAGNGALARAPGHPGIRHGPAYRRTGAYLDRAAGRIAGRRRRGPFVAKNLRPRLARSTAGSRACRRKPCFLWSGSIP